MKKETCILVDIDSTIAKSTLNISHPIDNNRQSWDEFQKDMKYYDPSYFEPIGIVVDLISTYISDFIFNSPKLIFLTSREDETTGKIKENTKILLQDIFPIAELDYILYMRKYNDFRPSETVKQDMLNDIIKEYNPLFVLDDDKNNVDMFTNNGIIVLQVHS